MSLETSAHCSVSTTSVGACASEPACGWRELATGDAEEHAGEGLVDLVGMGPARDVERVYGVLSAHASGTRSCESRVPQSREGVINATAWVANLRLVVRVNVDAGAEVRVGNEHARPLSVLRVGHLHHGRHHA